MESTTNIENNNNIVDNEKDEQQDTGSIVTPISASPSLSSVNISPTTTSPTTTTTTTNSVLSSPTTSMPMIPAIPTTTSNILGGINLTSNMPAVGKRLNVQIETLENRINNDMYDTEAWTLLLNEVQSQPISIARDIYSRFLTVFPTAGRYWKLYVEQEMAEKNYDIVEKIFFDNLRNVKNVEFWKTYITYIKQIKYATPPTPTVDSTVTATTTPNTTNKEEIIKAFEFALESIGMDISSTSIWTDYIGFLKEQKATTQFEEGQKMEAIRKLYQRAIENPMHDLDNIYKEYEVYENSLHKALAKALLGEHQGKYQHARNVYRDRKALLEGILRNMLAKPPRSSDKEEHQVRLWRKLISYERSNPQKFDANTLRNRVIATYNQCLLCLYHYPDIWYEAATYLADCGSVDLAITMFDRSLIALPKNLFIHFAYADYLESQKRQVAAKEVYEKLIINSTSLNGMVEPLVWIQYMKFSRRTERIDGPRKIFKRAKSTADCTYHVYIALGLIEYYINQDTRMARDIFEIGLKKFPNEIAFINFYLEFLSNLNEENNTRVLFEKLLTMPSLEKSRSLWRKFLDFEYRQNQDISSIMKLEKRYQTAVPTPGDKTGVLQALNRYKFLNLWSCHPSEIEIITKNILIDDDQSTSGGKDGHHHGGGGHSRSNQADGEGDHGKDGKDSKYKGKKGKGYKDKHQSANVPVVDSKPTFSTMIPTSTWKVKKPDLSQMIPYRSEIGKFTQSSVIQSDQPRQSISGQSGNVQQGGSGNVGIVQQQGGGNVQNRSGLPDFIFYLLQNLPQIPGGQYSGPFVDTDTLINIIRDTSLPIQFLNQQQQQQQQQQLQLQQQQLQQQQMLQGNRQSPILTSATPIPLKRKQPEDELNDANNTNLNTPTLIQSPVIPSTTTATTSTTSNAPTNISSIPKSTSSTTSSSNANDIYRKRQANKLSKKS